MDEARDCRREADVVVMVIVERWNASADSWISCHVELKLRLWPTHWQMPLPDTLLLASRLLSLSQDA